MFKIGFLIFFNNSGLGESLDVARIGVQIMPTPERCSYKRDRFIFSSDLTRRFISVK